MISRLQAESGARIQVAPGIVKGFNIAMLRFLLLIDGSEINGERQVTISGTQDTVELVQLAIYAALYLNPIINI